MTRRLRLTRPEAPEHAIQRAVLRYLAVDRRVAWAERFNTGAHVVETRDARGRRQRRFIRYAFRGCPDVLGQLVSGHLLAVEVKRPSTRPTAEQAAFLACVASNGGVAIVARRVEDVAWALERFCAHLDTGELERRGLGLSGPLEPVQPSGGAAGQGARTALKPEPDDAPTEPASAPRGTATERRHRRVSRGTRARGGALAGACQ